MATTKTEQITDPLKLFILGRMTAEMSDIGITAETYIASSIREIAKSALGIDTSFGRTELKDTGCLKSYVYSKIQARLDANPKLMAKIIKVADDLVEKMTIEEMGKELNNTINYKIRDALAKQMAEVVDAHVASKKDAFEGIIKQEIDRLCADEMQSVINKANSRYR